MFLTSQGKNWWRSKVFKKKILGQFVVFFLSSQLRFQNKLAILMWQSQKFAMEHLGSENQWFSFIMKVFEENLIYWLALFVLQWVRPSTCLLQFLDQLFSNANLRLVLNWLHKNCQHILLTIQNFGLTVGESNLVGLQLEPRI